MKEKSEAEERCKGRREEDDETKQGRKQQCVSFSKIITQSASNREANEP